VADNPYVSPLENVRVKRVLLLSAGGVAIFLSYVAVLSGMPQSFDVGSITVSSVAFAGVVTALVMGAYIAWETRNVRLAAKHAEELNAELMRKEIELGRMATLDELTRLQTVRAFDNTLRLEFERKRRYGRDLSLLLLDIEHVGGLSSGKMSKTYLLAEVAAIFRNVLRANDVGGRHSGDRLSLLLPETDEIRALLVADKIRDSIARHELLGLLADGGVRVALGVGIAVADDEMASHHDLMAAAETALGEALTMGANQVQVWRRPRPDEQRPAGPFRLAS